jgi:flagellar biosynthetic protein FliR
MMFEASLQWAVAVLLCSIRLGALLAMTPILEGFGIPLRIRLMLVLALSAVLAGGLELAPAALPHTAAELLLAGLAEALTGGLMAFGVHTAFNAVAFAGKLLDIQMGFGMANVYDPITRSQAPLLGSALGILATLMFFLIDAHHLLLRGVAFSLETVSLGRLLVLDDPAILVAQFGKLFTFGLVLMAPVVFALFLLELGMAVLSRVLPQMNLFIVGIPAKIALGFVLLHLTVRYSATVLPKTFGTIASFIEQVIG